MIASILFQTIEAKDIKKVLQNQKNKYNLTTMIRSSSMLLPFLGLLAVTSSSSAREIYALQTRNNLRSAVSSANKSCDNHIGKFKVELGISGTYYHYHPFDMDCEELSKGLYGPDMDKMCEIETVSQHCPLICDADCYAMAEKIEAWFGGNVESDLDKESKEESLPTTTEGPKDEEQQQRHPKHMDFIHPGFNGHIPSIPNSTNDAAIAADASHELFVLLGILVTWIILIVIGFVMAWLCCKQPAMEDSIDPSEEPGKQDDGMTIIEEL